MIQLNKNMLLPILSELRTPVRQKFKDKNFRIEFIKANQRDKIVQSNSEAQKFHQNFTQTAPPLFKLTHPQPPKKKHTHTHTRIRQFSIRNPSDCPFLS